MFLIIDKDQCSEAREIIAGTTTILSLLHNNDLAQNILRIFVNIYAGDTIVYGYNSKDLHEQWLIADLSAGLVPSQGNRERTDFYHLISPKQS